MRRVAFCLALFVTTLAGSVLTPTVRAQGEDLKIWQGVYAAEQAERGQTIYEAYCTRCHGLNLLGGRQGNAGGPALKDTNFWLNWERAPLSSLYSKISRTMPLDSPASLRDNDYTDVLSYILRENAFPAGSAELNPVGLDAFRIVRKDGTTSDAPDFSLVQVVGCLVQGPNDSWIVTRGTAPLVTREETSSASSLSDAASRVLGPNTFRLIGVRHLKPEAQLGSRIEIRGLINRTPNDERIDVLALQVISPACGG
ncbi:MAG: c-type cytochrome [Acidobacteria bacterium]|nr:c-type cytochrome [Acidobacteriota bacterium]